jgi:two-component sensor histidine kinase
MGAGVEAAEEHRAASAVLPMLQKEFHAKSLVKCAFTAGRGTFILSLTRENGPGRMVMSDDGPGIPEDAAPGLGHKLIDVLTTQLEGEATWSSGAKGTTLTLEFPIRTA